MKSLNQDILSLQEKPDQDTVEKTFDKPDGIASRISEFSAIQQCIKAGVFLVSSLYPFFAQSHPDETSAVSRANMEVAIYQLQATVNGHFLCDTLQPLLVHQGDQTTSELHHRLAHDNCLDIHGYIGLTRTFLLERFPKALRATPNDTVVAHFAFELPLISFSDWSLKIGPSIGFESRLNNPYHVFHLGFDIEIVADRFSIALGAVPQFLQTETNLHEGHLNLNFSLIPHQWALGVALNRNTLHLETHTSDPISIPFSTASLGTEVRITGFCLTVNTGIGVKTTPGHSFLVGVGQCSDLIHDNNDNHHGHIHDRSGGPRECHHHDDGTSHCGDH